MTHPSSRPRSTHGTPAAARDIYVIGYGSLLEQASRVSTWPQARVAFPVSVQGVRRGWFDQMPADLQGMSPTYLGAVEDSSASTNGVVYQVSPSEFAAYKERETGYLTVEVKPDRLTFYDGRTAAPDATFYFFATTDPRPPDEAHPIVQSYVDIVMTGAMEQEAAYPLAREAGFVEALVNGTDHWSPHWINDRIHPYRPFATVPQAYDIDAVLTAHFPDFYPGRPRR